MSCLVDELSRFLLAHSDLSSNRIKCIVVGGESYDKFSLIHASTQTIYEEIVIYFPILNDFSGSNT